jgi:hypothetical protein
MICIVQFRRLEEIAIIRVYDFFLNFFGVKVLVKIRRDDDIDILQGIGSVEHWFETGNAHVRNAANIGPESGSSAAKEADVVCSNVVLDYIDGPTSYLPYLFFSRWSSWLPHLRVKSHTCP